MFFFFKQKTAYEMRISDWSSDVCSSDLPDVVQVDQDLVGRWGLGVAVSEERLGLGDGHGQHLADVLAAEGVLQHGRLEALALALLAGGGDPGHHRQVGVDHAGPVAGGAEIGRASCRERGCQYVSISVVAGSLKKKKKINVGR